MKIATWATGTTPADPPFDPSRVTPGLIGFLVFAGLILATWFLLVSFTRRLKRIQLPKAAAGDRPTAQPADSAPNRPGAGSRTS